MNIVDLLDHSQTIVAGHVTKVTDGFDAKGMPYTEVTINVIGHDPRAEGRDLHVPAVRARRAAHDARRHACHLGGRPAGWPTWRPAKSAIVFLYPKAKYTGLQTTVGLGYGKLGMGNGVAMNAHDNAGSLPQRDGRTAALLDSAEQQMFDTKKGPVNEDTLRKFLHRAVDGNWVKKGSIANAKR